MKRELLRCAFCDVALPLDHDIVAHVITQHAGVIVRDRRLVIAPASNFVACWCGNTFNRSKRVKRRSLGRNKIETIFEHWRNEGGLPQHVLNLMMLP